MICSGPTASRWRTIDLTATLTFVIVASQIGTASGQVSRTTGAALLAAGLLSAAIFPALAVKLLPAEPGRAGSRS